MSTDHSLSECAISADLPGTTYERAVAQGGIPRLGSQLPESYGRPNVRQEVTDAPRFLRTGIRGFTGGVTDILEAPFVYLAYQHLVGGIKARYRCVTEHVRSRPGLRVLDIGCGPGYVTQWLAPETQYVGLDTDLRYIRYAQRHYGDRGQFYCETLSEAFLDRHQLFDLVVMNGVLHHLDDSLAKEVLRLSSQALAAGGRLITMDGYYADQLHPIARFLLNKDRGRFIRRAAQYLALARGVYGEVRAYDHPDYFRVPYATLVMECDRA